MLPPDEYAPPPLSSLEPLVLEADIDYRLSFDEACANVRRWLRSEIGARRAQAHAADNRVPRRVPPTAEEMRWAAEQPPEVRAALTDLLAERTVGSGRWPGG